MSVLRDPLRTVLLALVVLAALAAGWFGFSWFSAAQDTELSYGRERDAVLQVAGEALATLHTVDYHAAGKDVDRWLRVTAGDLHSELDADRESLIKRARGTRTTSTAKLVQAAVTDLDALAGSARVIAVLDVRVARAGGKASTERRRMNADLLRTAGGWRISAVEAAS